MFVLKSIVRLCRPYYGVLAILLICIGLETAYGALSPLSFKYLIDDAFLPKNIDMFLLVLGLLLGGGVLFIASGVVSDYLLSKMSENILYDLRTRLFTHMTKQSLDFYANFEQGSLMSRVTSDLMTVDGAVSGTAPRTMRELLGLAIGLYLLTELNWQLALAMASGFILLFLSPNLLRKRASDSSAAYRSVQDAYIGAVDEVLKGHRVIKGLHLKDYILARLDRHMRSMLAAGFRVTFAFSLLHRIPLTAFMMLNAGVITFGGYLIFQDKLSIGAFIAFYTIFLQVGQSVASFSQLVPSLIQAEISFRRIDEVLRYESKMIAADGKIGLHAIREAIAFKEVEFGYDDQASVIRNLSLQVPAGGLTAFVGPSGSGKSTALQLLLRFYDPVRGAVTVDGSDIRSINEDDFRRLTGVVFQDSFLFNTSIRENIGLASAGATPEEIEEAAKAAQIHDFIAGMPEGYDTAIKDFGANLSGGQRQRIAIARALVKNPQLLVLDEVTSALDPATEAEINALIDSFRGKRTIVTVTHRLSSVTTADRIVVFRNGHAAEIGTHEELMRLNGVYRSMWDKQHGFQLSGDGFSAKVESGRLSMLPFFAGIPAEQLAPVSSLFVTERYDAGRTVIREQEAGDKFYIIVRGSVAVTKGTERVAVLEDGDHFGEIALLRNIPRTAGITTIKPTVLLSLQREQLLELTGKYPAIRHALEQSLEERMK
ncbi:ABC transporter transmembrane domain-containing protein [Paenibacillus hamazuiensis]|uniref:ABC transporter transmembrane domain-containing protein n=1 Tax=Paenibacillus hamazuiensis TaxID=2936508 RepID=UPI00200C9AD3|nr:ABC transporter transmembrane domain-containing protein [Paenibacillus hamazuiensis]